jgi:hypothetical protein
MKTYAIMAVVVMISLFSIEASAGVFDRVAYGSLSEYDTKPDDTVEMSLMARANFPSDEHLTQGYDLSVRWKHIRTGAALTVGQENVGFTWGGQNAGGITTPYVKVGLERNVVKGLSIYGDIGAGFPSITTNGTSSREAINYIMMDNLGEKARDMGSKTFNPYDWPIKTLETDDIILMGEIGANWYHNIGVDPLNLCNWSIALNTAYAFGSIGVTAEIKPCENPTGGYWQVKKELDRGGFRTGFMLSGAF